MTVRGPWEPIFRRKLKYGDQFVTGSTVGNPPVTAIDADTSQTFVSNGDNQNTGEPQTFTVPAGVRQIFIECHGGEGGASGAFSGEGGGGIGAKVIGLFPVTPLEQLTVYVGKHSGRQHGGWPNGGSGGDGASGDNGSGGGGASSVRRSGGTFADSMIVAAGGGGGSIVQGMAYGDGGWLQGGDGGSNNGPNGIGHGATQTAIGEGTDNPTSSAFWDPADGHGDDWTSGHGGTPADGGKGGNGSSAVIGGFQPDGSGGGGGGWYGGGGGGDSATPADGNGGGGSSWINPSMGVLIEAVDGGAVGHDLGGRIIFYWNSP